jgi:hypothetical protein
VAPEFFFFLRAFEVMIENENPVLSPSDFICENDAVPVNVSL